MPAISNPAASGRSLKPNDFVCVRADHEDSSRAGKDGMVMSVDGDSVALYFGHDRGNRRQHVYCAGPEAWNLDELDLTTLDT